MHRTVHSTCFSFACSFARFFPSFVPLFLGSLFPLLTNVQTMACCAGCSQRIRQPLDTKCCMCQQWIHNLVIRCADPDLSSCLARPVDADGMEAYCGRQECRAALSSTRGIRMPPPAATPAAETVRLRRPSIPVRFAECRVTGGRASVLHLHLSVCPVHRDRRISVCLHASVVSVREFVLTCTPYTSSTCRCPLLPRLFPPRTCAPDLCTLR